MKDVEGIQKTLGEIQMKLDNKLSDLEKRVEKIEEVIVKFPPEDYVNEYKAWVEFKNKRWLERVVLILGGAGGGALGSKLWEIISHLFR